MRIEILYSPGCLGLEETKSLIKETMLSLGINGELLCINTDIDKRSYYKGSPTILVDGEDIDPLSPEKPNKDGCRIYENGNPYPPRYMIEAAILRALKPKKILFMCVHNSVRSILAEGIARHLAPADVEILSAGSNPGGVKNDALKVLSEIGISTVGLYSKSVYDIDTKGVDCVITLCEEEACPLFLGSAIKLHWGLKDPSTEPDLSKRLNAFRKTRDELYKRISLLFREKTIE
ncbi:MAG: arsenate reductase ArsC [Deltaproteobacteria bacterium]|nr:arsenate reductase ArsC [Deltaproteobacteria bacterium]